MAVIFYLEKALKIKLQQINTVYYEKLQLVTKLEGMLKILSNYK